MGVAEYPNHYKMKTNRLFKLKQAKGKCEVCHQEAKYIHHIDGSKDNHKLENLSVLCNKCHGIIHSDRINKKNESIGKYKRLYGMSIKEMVNKFGGSPANYYNWHYQKRLQEYLDDPSIFSSPKVKPLTKYRKLYGMTIKEMVEKYGKNIDFYTKLHYEKKLENYLHVKKVGLNANKNTN